MWTFIHQLGSPKSCYRFAGRLLPWVAVLCLLSFGYGLAGALYWAPADYQQGEVFRIIYLHVPCAILSMAIYAWMSVNVILYLVWKLKVADMMAKVSAPMGATFTFLALLTGSLWGKPTWGTYWIWDARLSSELILLFVYLGIILLRSSLMDPVAAAKMSGILTLVGCVNLPIIHYSVVWWHTLHQGATLLQFARPKIAPQMLQPLLVLIVAFSLYFAWWLLLRLRTELLAREQKSQWIAELFKRS
ncbi:MAG TPA: heme ABC transporter permease CcmC [Coxiellaceae bacterium]|nr:heme ABC transporter permease CcmC [Coxiellaceae bacterium]